MSGHLGRALGSWVAGKVTGLHVCAGDIANTKYRYPECVVSELSHSTSAFGAGKRLLATKNPSTGYVATVGRLHIADTTFRLTIQAADTSTKSGQEIVEDISSTIENAVLALQSNAGQTVLVDSAVTPSVSFPLESLRQIGRQTLDPDTTGEPVLYRKALTLRLLRLVPVMRPVEAVIETILVEDADA